MNVELAFANHQFWGLLFSSFQLSGGRAGYVRATASVALLLAALTPAPTSAQTVSRVQFRAIIAELTARPNIAPRVVAPEPGANDAHRVASLKTCAIARRDVVFAVPDKLAAEPGKPTRYTIERNRLPILADRGRPSHGAVFAVTEAFAVNADGAPRSYHPLDPFGRCTGDGAKRVCALDALCNAGTRLFDGTTEIKCSERDAYAAAWSTMWAEITARRATPIARRYWRMDRSGRTDTHFGFFHPAKPMTVVLRHNIIARDRNSRPCVRDVAGARYAGYFVSKTSLKGDQGSDETEAPNRAAIVSDARCNPLPYVNPEVLPGIVIPVGGFAGASVGDLAIVYRRDQTGQERYVYAVVSDEGPNHKFGEGNIALNAALKGVQPKVNSITDIYALDIRSKGDTRERIGVLILRGTSSTLQSDLKRTAVETAAERAFKAWGGGTIKAARARYMACFGALD